jgi:hypothetical protein
MLFGTHLQDGNVPFYSPLELKLVLIKTLMEELKQMHLGHICSTVSAQRTVVMGIKRNEDR